MYELDSETLDLVICFFCVFVNGRMSKNRTQMIPDSIVVFP